MKAKESKKERIERWIKEEFNPKAFLMESDPRCGHLFAVTTMDGCSPINWTRFLPLNTLEEVVRMLVRYNSFIKIKNA